MSCERLFSPTAQWPTCSGTLIMMAVWFLDPMRQRLSVYLHGGAAVSDTGGGWKRYGIVVCSSNYTLYGDLSHRVMSIVREMVPNQEIYSIDECFVHFGPRDDYMAMTRSCVERSSKE